MKGDIRAETVSIKGHNGDAIEAYLSQPLDRGRFGGAVVIHHLPGYDEATKEITHKFAFHGFLAVCPNLYTRDAPGATPEQAAAAVREAGGAPDERVVGDVAGAVSYLRSLERSNGKVGTIGYCSGGRHSLLSACRLQLDAAVDCYGGFVVVPPPPEYGLTRIGPILDLVENLSCPLLGLFGSDDPQPSATDTAELERALTEHGKDYEFHTYEGAGHAFFATNRPMYRPEVANEAWGEVLGFFGRHLSS